MQEPGSDGAPFLDSGSVVYSRVVEEPTTQLQFVTRVGDERDFVALLHDVKTENLVVTIYLRGGHQMTIRAASKPTLEDRVRSQVNETRAPVLDPGRGRNLIGQL